MRRLLLASLLALAACRGGSAGVSGQPVDPPARIASASPEWWNGAVFYEVFVRSYRDSGGDGVGDLAGLVEKLDYLNDGNPSSTTSLGVDAIWLMPIYPSPSYHGYDVTDYEDVNPAYGDLAGFDTLIAEAHRRGIKVILDFVPNHSSDQHPWFIDSASGGPAHRDWYVWSVTDPGWRQPWNAPFCGGNPTWSERNGAWYYGLFWSGMPDLNWRTPALRDAVKAAASFWLARGADGFRLDAVRYLVENGSCAGQQDQPETHLYLKDLAGAVRGVRADAALIGEAWADTATIASYFGSGASVPGGDELPLPFDFPLAGAVVAGVAAGSAAPVAAALDAVAAAYPAGAGDAPFLTNHDQVRLATQLGNDPGRLRLAAAILLTLQGSPFLYYGEEVGTQNGDCASDECKRTPMAWDGSPGAGFSSGTPWWPLAPGAATANVAAQIGDPGSLLSRYRELIRVRKACPPGSSPPCSTALGRGGTRRLETGNPALLAFVRSLPGETVLVVHNLGTGFAAGGPWSAGGAAADVLFADPGASATGSGGRWSVSLPARGTGIWRLR